MTQHRYVTPARRPTESTGYPGRGPVLLVGAADSLRGRTRGVLGRHGFTVQAFADGDAALAIDDASLAHASLILSDVVLPGLNGREIAERLLRESDISLTEISQHLSFSELSAFTRAATRWFGMPPRVYRTEVRRGTWSSDIPQ